MPVSAPVAPRVDAAALAAAYAHCARVTRDAHTNFAWAFATLPRDARRSIRVFYAFSRVLDDAVDAGGPEGSRIDARRARLDALRAELDRAWAGAATEPVFVALADVARRFGIDRALCDELVVGVAMDLDTRRYATFADTRRYCYRVASVVGLVCLRLFGCHDPAAEAPAVDLGLAMQLTNICRDVGEDLARDRIYLPQDELERFGVREAALRGGVVDDAFRACLAFQVARAREHFARGRALLPLLPRRARACPAALAGGYEALLRRIEARGYDVLHGRVALSRVAKLRVVVGAWVRAWVG